MAAMMRFLKQRKTWPSLNSLKSFSNSSNSSLRQLPSPSYYRPTCEHMYSSMSEGRRLKLVSESAGSWLILPAVLAGVFGTGLLETSQADANEVDSGARLSSESPSNYVGMEKIANQERQRVEELLRNRGMQPGSYPPFSVAVRGQKVTIKFQIPPTCDVSHLIIDLVSRLGLKAEEHGGGSEMILRAWVSAVAWQVTLNHPKKQNESSRDEKNSEDMDKREGNLCILIFESLISSDSSEIEFIKQGTFSSKELDALVCALKLASGRMDSKRAMDKKPKGYVDRRDNKPNTARIPSMEKSLATLESMGVRVFGLDEPQAVSVKRPISWDNIAGYDKQKREIEDTILLALHSPEVYDDIARGTRSKFESNRPRAVLFEGPPGTGKTSCARVISHQAGLPLLYVPLEVVMSKYYGESERLLGTVFSLANELPNGAIIFLDEVDSFATARDNEMHEATRRILSVLLRQIDGFEQEKKVVVIAATNRKQDLDPALISRFDSMITFGLPDQRNREEIAAQYAKHLTKSELVEFSSITEEMSGRDIRDICQQAERRWASKIIRGQAPSSAEQGHLPPIQEYIDSAEQRRQALLSTSSRTNESHFIKKRLALA